MHAVYRQSFSTNVSLFIYLFKIVIFFVWHLWLRTNPVLVKLSRSRIKSQLIQIMVANWRCPENVQELQVMFTQQQNTVVSSLFESLIQLCLHTVHLFTGLVTAYYITKLVAYHVIMRICSTLHKLVCCGFSKLTANITTYNIQ